MRGHIRKHRKGYAIVLYLGRGPKGQRRYRWFTGYPTRPDAERALPDLLKRAQGGLFSAHTAANRPRTLGDYLRIWLDDYAAGRVTPRTLQGYRQMVDLHLTPKLGGLRLDRLQPWQFERYYAEAQAKGRIDGRGGLSGKTVRHHHRLLSVALKIAVRWGWIPDNPVRREMIDAPPVIRHEADFLSPDEAATYLQAASRFHLFPAILLALGAGLRRSEVIGLRWMDVDLEALLIQVRQRVVYLKGGVYDIGPPKTHRSRRRLPLAALIALALRAYRDQWEATAAAFELPTDDAQLLFRQPDGRPVHPDTLSQAAVSAARRCGLKVSLHDLRHSFASLLAAEDVHPRLAQELLGHSTIATTMDIYTHVVPSAHRAAIKPIERVLSNILSNPAAPDDADEIRR